MKNFTTIKTLKNIMQRESPIMFLNCRTQHNKDGNILKILIYKLLLKINSK